MKEKLQTKKETIGKKEYLYKGPEEHGVTQSLLARYIGCKERFYIHAMEGLGLSQEFSSRLEYGQFWHIAEECYLAGRDWMQEIKDYRDGLLNKYPLSGEDIVKWWNVCKVQFPIYAEYWRRNASKEKLQPIMQEVAFEIPYRLPSNRIVLLRGKWDAVNHVNRGRKQFIFLQENKTKGQILPLKIQKELKFDLQTMLYLVALTDEENHELTSRVDMSRCAIGGVNYNVVRRPLSGGKGTIRRHKPTKSKPQGESEEEYYARLKGVIEEDQDTYFARWEVGLGKDDIDRFKEEFLNPCLEDLCDDFEWWRECYKNRVSRFDYVARERQFTNHRQRHWRLPYGVYNPIMEGGSTDLEHYLETRDKTGLQRIESLFPELED